MKADEMASLFDVIEVEDDSPAESSDYNTTADDKVSPRSFDARCEDVQGIMDEEEFEPVNEHHEIIAAALEKAESKPTPKSKPTEIEPDSFDQMIQVDESQDESGGQYADEVARDMQEFEVEDDGETDGEEEEAPAKPSSPIFVQKPKPKLEPEPDPFDVESDDVFQVKPKTAGDNPLGLHGSDLKFYHECLQRYPQFTLYDGTVAFKEFYRHKVEMLKQVLSRYPILDIVDMEKEISSVNLDHFIGDDIVVTADIIRYRLDESYKWRARLSALMLKIIPQFYMWERWTDMLKSKLWKDHELKGAHRRDGLTMEHMSDIADYAGALKGLMESCKHADMVLKAASESLSRQLSCLQLNQTESHGTTQEGVEKIEMQRQQAFRKQVDDLDGFDSIGAGEKISAPTPQGVSTFNFGVEADDLAMLG